MGHGDQLMASGMARGAAKRGKTIAFGDGKRIIWDKHSEIIFRNNPNVAAPGSERSSQVEWIAYHKGSRIYNRISDDQKRWVWNYDFRAPRGEFFFNAGESLRGKRHGSGFVVIEPNVPMWKSSSVNKVWDIKKYSVVAADLRSRGYEVKQFSYPGDAGPILPGANIIATRDFRDAAAYLSNADLYIGPEGGLHHAAAALNVKGVVIFGGFIPPEVTGYEGHINLTGGAEACGSLHACAHCRSALDKISADEVTEAALQQLKVAA